MKTYEGYIDHEGNKAIRVIGPNGVDALPNLTSYDAGWGPDAGPGMTTAYRLIMDAYDGEEGAEDKAQEWYDDFYRQCIKQLDPDTGFSLSWYDVRKLVDGWEQANAG